MAVVQSVVTHILILTSVNLVIASTPTIPTIDVVSDIIFVVDTSTAHSASFFDSVDRSMQSEIALDKTNDSEHCKLVHVW